MGMGEPPSIPIVFSILGTSPINAVTGSLGRCLAAEVLAKVESSVRNVRIWCVGDHP